MEGHSTECKCHFNSTADDREEVTADDLVAAVGQRLMTVTGILFNHRAAARYNKTIENGVTAARDFVAKYEKEIETTRKWCSVLVHAIILYKCFRAFVTFRLLSALL